MTGRVVLAYSGGLDTAVAARTLKDERGLEVVAAFIDLGQPYERSAIEARAAAAGAHLRLVDAKSRFAAGFVLPALHANALYEGKYPLVSALARPLIAAEVVRLARETGAGFMAHGCTGKGNDQVRFETAFAALAPDLGIIAPVREAQLSRESSLALARAAGIPISTEAKTYSIDENLWGRTAECGPLEDPWIEPPEDAFGLTANPATAPDEPGDVTVSFLSGEPVALDGLEMSLPDLIATVTALAGAHGFGRVDMIENRLVGIKSRELYEVPGALALIAAHRDLEDLTLERDLAHEKAALERRWAELCYYGQWYGPLHAALRAFMAETQEAVTGEVRLRFHKGNCRVVGRRSPLALYDESLATYEGLRDRFDHSHAAGFISLWSLPLRVWGERESASGAPGAAAGEEGQMPAEVSLAPSVEPAASMAQPSGVPAAASANGGPAPAPVWHARFGAAPAEDAMAFTRSIGFDQRLLPHDLAATRAHVAALARAGVIDADERDRLVQAVDRLAREAVDGTAPLFDSDEDVHSAVERILTERLGALGAKVHAGRSRNDLAVTDLRLWTKDAAGGLADLARTLATALADRAGEHATSLVPGFTHLQHAQPVTLAHHLLAHAFPLARDAERLDRAASAADVSALGAGALAGSTLALDPATTATDLGFAAAFDNSIDAVADRDFALEFLAACVITAVHVSRLAEDLILWSTEEFGFTRMHDRYATGSSMMPQKRNPDVAELARAKAGRVLGDLVRLATVMKGLPLAYNRDLQEDKEAAFDAHDALAGSLAAMRGVVESVSFDTERMRRACDTGYLTATDVAEHLVTKGVPFRRAHERVASIVGALEAAGRTLKDVEHGEWSSLDPDLGPDLAGMVSPEAAVARRAAPGGPAAQPVERQLDALRARLGHAHLG